ncbi:MAG: 1,4-dihydroxy-2-naphthoate octaprenyltransferase [Planctomycetota bacterium]
MSRLTIWFQALRPFSFTASMTPVALGAALALASSEPARWNILPLVVLSTLLLHAGTNTLNDYFDFKKGIDKDHTYGSSRVLVDRLMEPAALLKASIAMFLAAALLGLVLIALRGAPILLLGLIGLAGGILYTASPIAYKYHALGDLLVFFLMGPLIVLGSFFTLTGRVQWHVFWVSLPLAMLVTAILSANNLRDIQHDTSANIKTLASLLGHNIARIEYCLLLLAAYLSVLVMIAAKILPPWSLLVLLTTPLAVKNITSTARSSPENTSTLLSLDVNTAGLHFAFGLLLTASILIPKLF